jgi:malate dehydrogenase
VSTIVLVDEAGTIAQGKALDIRQASPVDRFTTNIIGSNSLDAVINATMIVLADDAKSGEWRDNTGVGFLRRVLALNPSAPILCAGAQQAPLVERAARELGVARSRIFGSAPEAFRSAVMSLTALEAGCTPTDITLTVVGKPPQQIIVPWEDASIAGRRATSVLTPPAITRLDARLPRLWPPGPLALGAAAARAIKTAFARTPRVISAFVTVSGNEGVLPRVGMLPVTLDPRGVNAIVNTPLSSRDQVRLETALTS